MKMAHGYLSAVFGSQNVNKTSEDYKNSSLCACIQQNAIRGYARLQFQQNKCVFKENVCACLCRNHCCEAAMFIVVSRALLCGY